MPKGLKNRFKDVYQGDETTRAPCRSCAELVLEYDVCNPSQEVVPTKFHIQDELPRLPFLDENVKLGCEFCGLLLEIVQNAVKNDQGASVAGLSEMIPICLGDACFYTEHRLRTDATGEKNGAYGLKLELRVGDSQPKCLYFSLHADHGTEASTLGRIHRRRLHPSAVSETSIAHMQRWIQECDKHPMCRLSEKQFVPTRLIDVGAMDSAVPLLGTSRPAKAYAENRAFHAVGEKSINISQNASSFDKAVTSDSKGLPVDSMPRNFADAVAVARHLGIQYLWIDSLCIIQDSSEDWKCEAAMMHQVYKHAHVCIVATSARTSHDGFLERSLGREVHIPFTLPKGGGSHGCLYLRQTNDGVMCGFEFNVESSTWNERGWTFQERFLSRRLIHFCKNQAYFECRTTIWAEDNHMVQHAPMHTFHLGHGYIPGEEPPLVVAGNTSDESTGSRRCSFEIVGSAPEGDQEQLKEEETEDTESDGSDYSEELENIFEHWFRIAASYSARQLTYGTDKLIALSGLAKVAFSTGLVGRYFAGIWENDLLYGLLWVCSGADGKVSLSPSYRAPSWSWASMDGQIVWGNDWDRAELPPVFQFLDANIELAGQDVFGSISSARLTISGSPALVEIGDRDRTKQLPFDFSYHLMYEGRKIGFGHLDLRNPKLLPTALYALQLFEQYPKMPEQRRIIWCGLLLVQSGEQTRTFRRVGLFLLDEDDLDVFEDLEPSRITLI